MRGHETNMAAVHGNKHGRDAQRRITHNDYPMQRDQWCWTSARGCLRPGSCARGNSSRQLCVPLPSQGVLFLFSVWMRSPNPNDWVRFESGFKFIPIQLAKLSSDEVSVIDETSSVVDLSKAKKIETDANPSQYSVNSFHDEKRKINTNNSFVKWIENQETPQRKIVLKRLHDETKCPDSNRILWWTWLWESYW